MRLTQGVDTSSNNGNGTGVVNFSAIQLSGRTFAMIRVGYGTRTGGTFSPYISKSYRSQMEAARQAGLDTGVYWYTTALTVQEAQQEADACLKALEGQRVNYPVAFDQEYQPQIQALSRQQRTDLCRAFLERVKAAGYYPLLYGSSNWFDQYLYDNQLQDFDHWVADYSSRLTYRGSGRVGIWQYSGSGSIPGVEGPIDLNVAYLDYPTLIRQAGLNHLPPEQPEPTPEQPEPTPEQPEPTPEQPEPTPEQPEPTPEQPEPTPEQPEPTPEQPEPTPEQPEPTPEQPEDPQPSDCLLLRLWRWIIRPWKRLWHCFFH